MALMPGSSGEAGADGRRRRRRTGKRADHYCHFDTVESLDPLYQHRNRETRTASEMRSHRYYTYDGVPLSWLIMDRCKDQLAPGTEGNTAMPAPGDRRETKAHRPPGPKGRHWTAGGHRRAGKGTGYQRHCRQCTVPAATARERSVECRHSTPYDLYLYNDGT